MIGGNSRMTCKQLFKEIKILTLASLYIYIYIYIRSDIFYKKLLPIAGAKLQSS